MTRAPQTGRGVSRPTPHPRRPTRRGAPTAETAVLQTPRAPAGRRRTPLPTSPLKGGRSEEKEGGAQTARTGLSGIVVLGRRGGSPPFSLLPPGRGEVGRGVDPGSAGRTGGLPTDSASSPPNPPRGVSTAETAALQTPRAPARRRRTPLPTSPLKGGRSEEKEGGDQAARIGLSGIVVVGRRSGPPPFLSSPLEGGRSGGGLTRAPQAGRGVSRPTPHPRRPTRRGVSTAETAVLQTPRAPARRRRTPLPTSPLKGGGVKRRREETKRRG